MIGACIVGIVFIIILIIIIYYFLYGLITDIIESYKNGNPMLALFLIMVLLLLIGFILCLLGI